MNWKALSIICVGCLALTGACGDDDDSSNQAVSCPTSSEDMENLTGKACAKQGEQCLDPGPVCAHNYSHECNNGKWEPLDGLAAPCGDGGAGGGANQPFVCPTDLAKLQALEGTACDKAGQQCLDPGPVCAHNYSVECKSGKWTGLAGLAAPCEGGAGAGGAAAGGNSSTGGSPDVGGGAGGAGGAP